MKDMFNMMGKFREMQQKIKEAQDNLVNIHAEAEAGAGMVKAKVNGKKQIIRLDIDKDIINADDKEMMQDLVIAAVNRALADVEEKCQHYLQQNAQNILPDIPGMNLDNLMK